MFNSQRFTTAWTVWKTYRKEQHGFEYKSSITEDAAIKKLYNLVGKNEGLALLTIDHSMANGWKGFFEVPSPKQPKAKPIPVFTEQIATIAATDEQAKKHISEIRQTISKIGNSQINKPEDELLRAYNKFRRMEWLYTPLQIFKLHSLMAVYPEKYKEEIAYLETKLT